VDCYLRRERTVRFGTVARTGLWVLLLPRRWTRQVAVVVLIVAQDQAVPGLPARIGEALGWDDRRTDLTDGRKNYEPTDTGNADRLVDTYGDHLRYCFPSKAWLIWDGSIALVVTIESACSARLEVALYNRVVYFGFTGGFTLT
jgi:hypothetical protein